MWLAEGLVVLDGVECDLVAESASPLPGTQKPLRPGDMAEPAPAEAEQVLRGETAAAGVVRRDGRLVAVHRLGHRVYHRDARIQPDARPRLDSSSGHTSLMVTRLAGDPGSGLRAVPLTRSAGGGAPGFPAVPSHPDGRKLSRNLPATLDGPCMCIGR